MTRPRREQDPGGGLAVLTALVQTAGTWLATRGEAGPGVLGYVLLAFAGLALGGRLRNPRATLVVVAAATVAYHALVGPGGPTFLALIVAVLAAVKTGHRLFAWVTAAVSYPVWVLLTGPTRGQALTLAAWALGIGLVAEPALKVAGMLGQMLREQRRLQEERQRRQASEERLRIAQELHDVLGHHLSLINLRAGVGLHLKERDPDEAWAALATIKQASAEALREVQSVLTTLYPAGEAAPRAPAPRLDRLHELTADAGLPVRTTVAGEPRPLPADVDRAAYRIVQEALTNIRRHAGVGATAAITIEYGREDELTVQVQDDGGARERVADPAEDGIGITGMRERATALGGHLTAGPLPDGGWRVRATLPVTSPSAPRERANQEAQ
jgi:signal transduction histidine kinase